MLEETKFKWSDQEYVITEFDALKCRGYYITFIKHVGNVFGELCKYLPAVSELESISEENFLQKLCDYYYQILENLYLNLDSLEDLQLMLLSKTTCNGEFITKDNFNQIFKGRLDEMEALTFRSILINFRPFLQAILIGNPLTPLSMLSKKEETTEN